VGIGASAGGLEALKALLSAVPADPGMAFIIIQHLDPEQKSHMAELLAKQTALRVVEAEQDRPVEPGYAYTIPPGTFLTLREGRLHLEKAAPGRAVRMPVDLLFHSLAEGLGEAAVGIVLSGTGSDGTLGVRAIRGAGGLAVAQDPASAEFDGMPQSAIATGLVDYVLPPAEMAHALLAYLRHEKGLAAVGGAGAEDAVSAILTFLRQQAKSDFRGYKRSTVLRRIERRMRISQTATPAGYLELLRDDPEEATRLVKDMLIGVTSFFRDREAFEELRGKAIVPLVRAQEEGASVRVWVPGCATGEEAYSVAMLVFQELEAAGTRAPVQMFASDIDEEALATARAGVYADRSVANVPADLLERFFVKVDGGYRVAQQLREAVVFTTQNLVTAPPFSNLDLISCRNVFIYFSAEAQETVLSLFAFALREGGYLFLGKADGIVGHAEFFRALTGKGRLYQRTEVPHRAPGRFEVGPGTAPAPGGIEQAPRPAPLSLLSLPPQILLDHFGASLVLVDPRGTLLAFYGQSGRYLAHPTGRADLDLFSMARPRLPGRLRVGVRHALAQHATVRLERIPVLVDGGSAPVDVTITPYLPAGAAEPVLAVIFQEAPPAEVASTALAGGEVELGVAALVEQLEAELRANQAELLAATSEFGASNEQLRAIHEEAVSVNEELQSTNEELEASKEELQSLNEELTTVNAQLGEKMEELTAANNDLLNLFSATEIATVFLDRKLRIRRFTPAAEGLLNLIASDVGRPIGHLSPNFTGADLGTSAEVVLRQLSVVEQEVVGRDGQWYTMRAFPYRTTDDRTDGVVVTLADVTRLKHIEEALERERDFTAAVLSTEGALVTVLDPEGRIVRFNRACEQLTGYTFGEVKGRPFWDLLLSPEERRTVQEAFAKLRRGQFPDEHENHWVAKDGRRRRLHWFNTALTGATGAVEYVIATGLDITERRQAEEGVKRNEARLEGLLRMSQHHASSIQGLLDLALDEAITLTGSSIGYLYRYDDAKQEFTLNSWSKEVMEQCTIRDPQAIYQLAETGIWGEAVRQARPIMVNDFHAPHPLKKGYPEGHAPLHRYLTIPVFSGDHIVGVVGVANKDTDYDSTDVRQLVLLMDSAWKITERRQAEEERERLHQEIEQQGRCSRPPLPTCRAASPISIRTSPSSSAMTSTPRWPGTPARN
jgi:two-component system CheB/CheR fusion protein